MILQRFDFGEQAAPAKASLRISRHGEDVRQFRAPAAAFLLAGHHSSALCAAGFHRAMMAQL
jgi:hypothetical protein